MKILFVGDFNLVLLPDLITELSKRAENTYTLLGALSGKFYTVDTLPGYVNTHAPRNRMTKKLRFGLSLLKTIGKVCFMKPVDVINIHYVNPYYVILLPLFKWKSTSLVLNVYGSDYYLPEKRARQLQMILFRAADRFLFSNPAMAEDFISEFPQFAVKTTICRFGLKLLPQIDAYAKNKLSAKQLLGFPHDKVVVSCGHSAHIRERHTEIIAQLKALPDWQKEKVFLVFPFTYNVSDEFINTIHLAMLKTGIAYHILTTFLKEEEVAAYRAATDVLISIPSSDQMTASMLETLYAGNVVLTGSWLPYEALDEQRVSYVKIDKVDELAVTLQEILSRIIKSIQFIDTEQNTRIIRSLFSWDSCANEWLTLFASLQKPVSPDRR